MSPDIAKRLASPDSRWTLHKVFCGYPRPRWVIRFCGDFLSNEKTRKDAREVVKKARQAYYETLETGGSAFQAARNATSAAGY